MFTVILQAVFFFLPSYMANAAPVILNKLGWLTSLAVPVDAGAMWQGERLFGKTKTYRGIIGGVLTGMLTVAVQAWLQTQVPELAWLYLLDYDLPMVLMLGFLLGLGEGLGDLFKSFIKRRLHIESSRPFIPFDQLSFLGALGLSWFYVAIPLPHIVTIVVLSPLVPMVANVIAYKLGLKEVWW